MFPRPLNDRALAALAVTCLLGACHPAAERPAGHLAAESAPPSLAALDNGATLLADVDNARAAIADKDPMAADNDVAQAGAFAVRLPDSGSLRPSAAIPAPLSAFEAEVML